MSDPNKLYYHKYINLKKTFEKMDIPDEDKEEFLKMIEIKITREKERSEEKRWEYLQEDVECETCHKLYPRTYIYKHKKIHLTPQQKEKKWKQQNKKETELLNNLLAGIGQTK
jgi:hypothetical protein